MFIAFFFFETFTDPFPHKVLKRLNVLYPRCCSVLISDKLVAKPASTLTAVDITTSRFKCFQWEFFGCLVDVADILIILKEPVYTNNTGYGSWGCGFKGAGTVWLQCFCCSSEFNLLYYLVDVSMRSRKRNIFKICLGM